MAKLYVSLTSPFARKARVLRRELDLTNMVEEIVVDPWTDARLRAINPLSKVPSLVLADGSALYDSVVICEYLDEAGNGHFFPRASLLKAPQGKWRALTLQALGDGLSEAVVRVFVEGRRPEAERNQTAIARQQDAIAAALAMLERAAAKFAAHPTIGEVAVGCALGYADFRQPGLDWRAAHPRLTDWFAKFSDYPAMKATVPPAP